MLDRKVITRFGEVFRTNMCRFMMTKLNKVKQSILYRITAIGFFLMTKMFCFQGKVSVILRLV